MQFVYSQLQLLKRKHIESRLSDASWKSIRGCGSNGIIKVSIVPYKKCLWEESQQQQLINEELPLHSRWTIRITSRRLRDRWSRRRRRSPGLAASADLQLSQRRSLLPTPSPVAFGLRAPQRPNPGLDCAEEAVAAAVAACPTRLRSRPASTTRTAADGGDRERAAAREGGLVRAERGGWTAAAAPSSRGWGWRWGDSIGYRLGRFPSPAGLGVRKRVCGLGSGMGRVGPKQYPTGIKSRLMTRLMTWTL
jgi:hypothetical protein